jgi:hypothetical protein
VVWCGRQPLVLLFLSAAALCCSPAAAQCGVLCSIKPEFGGCACDSSCKCTGAGARAHCMWTPDLPPATHCCSECMELLHACLSTAHTRYVATCSGVRQSGVGPTLLTGHIGAGARESGGACTACTVALVAAAAAASHGCITGLVKSCITQHHGLVTGQKSQL